MAYYFKVVFFKFEVNILKFKKLLQITLHWKLFWSVHLTARFNVIRYYKKICTITVALKNYDINDQQFKTHDFLITFSPIIYFVMTT